MPTLTERFEKESYEKFSSRDKDAHEQSVNRAAEFLVHGIFHYWEQTGGFPSEKALRERTREYIRLYNNVLAKVCADKELARAHGLSISSLDSKVEEIKQRLDAVTPPKNKEELEKLVATHVEKSKQKMLDKLRQ